MRIVSLMAGATEIVCALGLRENLVGRSHDCDYPESVLELPVCTAPKFKTSGASYMIDERSRAILQESLSIYRVDADLLLRLKPCRIITQTQLEVCSVSLAEVEAAAAEMIEAEPQIVNLEPHSLSSIFENIKKIGTACGVEQKAQDLVKSLRSAIKKIEADCATGKKEPSVAVIEWIDPLMPAANWMPELVKGAGGKNLFGRKCKPSRVMPWKELSDADPDVLIVAPSGFTIAQTLEGMPLLLGKKGWKALSCVRQQQVYLVDGKQFFNRPGPRVLESLQIMAEILHPGRFQFGHEGKNWVRYSDE